MLSEGINVVEETEVGEEVKARLATPADGEEDGRRQRVAEQTGTAVAATTTQERADDRTEIREVRHLSMREMGSAKLCCRRGRNRHRHTKASRPAASR